MCHGHKEPQEELLAAKDDFYFSGTFADFQQESELCGQFTYDFWAHFRTAPQSDEST